MSIMVENISKVKLHNKQIRVFLWTEHLHIFLTYLFSSIKFKTQLLSNSTTKLPSSRSMELKNINKFRSGNKQIRALL